MSPLEREFKVRVRCDSTRPGNLISTDPGTNVKRFAASHNGVCDSGEAMYAPVVTVFRV